MPFFSPPTQKADLAGTFFRGTQQQSRETAEEKGFWPISDSCVFFSASSNQHPNNRAATPLENMYRGSHSASYPASLAAVSHPPPAIIVQFFSPQKLQRLFSSFIAPFPDRFASSALFPMARFCASFRKATQTFHTIVAIAMMPCAVHTRKTCRLAT